MLTGINERDKVRWVRVNELKNKLLNYINSHADWDFSQKTIEALSLYESFFGRAEETNTNPLVRPNGDSEVIPQSSAPNTSTPQGVDYKVEPP